jgi:hypothetical protein
MKHDSQSRYKSTLAFTDLLFNVLIGFAFLFIIAFILINPTKHDAKIKAKAEFMVIMEWDEKSLYDIDLWMQDPLKTIVGFPNKESGWLHLDKDDLGATNDTVILKDGTSKTIFLNREIMTVRGSAPGEYIVNIHLYSVKGRSSGPIDVHVEILKINPYGEIYNGITTLQVNGQEETVLRFTVNDMGNVISTNKLQKRFAGKHLQPGAPTVSGGRTSSTSSSLNSPPSIPENFGSGSHPRGGPVGGTNISNTDPNDKEERERGSYTITPQGAVIEEDLNRYDGPSHPNPEDEANSISDDDYDLYMSNPEGGF